MIKQNYKIMMRVQAHIKSLILSQKGVRYLKHRHIQIRTKTY